MKLISILSGEIRVKTAPLKAKLKKWISISFLQNTFNIKAKDFFKKLLDVTPADQNDYYVIGKWMVSKRLAFAAVILIGVLSFSYISAMLPVHLFQNGKGYKTYRYNSIPLKFLEGPVEILGKSGYTAYIGTVKDGEAAGTGTLFRKNKETVYTGQFENNKFNGTGSLYYSGNLLQYTGQFKDNEFEGTGTLYRKNGIKNYEGSFHQGKMEGEGKLYNASETMIYEGNFQDNTIVYEELAGKKTSEIAEMYQGEKTIYSDDRDYCVVLNEIKAMYYGEGGEDTLEEEWKAGGVYVLTDHALIDGQKFNSIDELNQYFGEPEYEGYTNVNLSDAVAWNLLSEEERKLKNAVLMKTRADMENVITVLDYDNSYLVYLYIYRKEGFQYTFICADKNTGFSLYLIEGIEE